jgi:hypothetical protein
VIALAFPPRLPGAFGRESESADVGAPDIGAALFQHGEPPAIEAEDRTGHPHAPNPAADHETRGQVPISDYLEGKVRKATLLSRTLSVLCFCHSSQNFR